MDDSTEAIRRQLAADINGSPRRGEVLEAEFGKVWDTAQLQDDIDVLGYRTPIVVVRRRSDLCLGSLFFQHFPHFYFAFQAD